MLKPQMISWPGIAVRRHPMILPNSGKLSLSREFAEEDYETCGERIHGTLLATCDQSASRICPRIGPVSLARQECPSRSDELTLWHLPYALAPVSVARQEGWNSLCGQTGNSVHELMPILQPMHEILLCRLTQCTCPLLIQAKRHPAGVDLETCYLKPGKVCGCTVSHRFNGTTSCSGSRAPPEDCGNCLP